MQVIYPSPFPKLGSIASKRLQYAVSYAENIGVTQMLFIQHGASVSCNFAIENTSVRVVAPDFFALADKLAVELEKWVL